MGETDVDGESGVDISRGHSLYKVRIQDLKSRGLLVTKNAQKGCLLVTDSQMREFSVNIG